MADRLGDGAATRHSFCRVCHHGCPVLVEVDDGAATRVTGDPEGGPYQGFTCVKGRAQPALLRHRDRLLRSQKRVGPGRFEAIDVEQAMDEIATRLQGILDEHGPRAVASYFGTMAATSSTTSPLLYAFMNGIASPMRFTPNTIDKPGKSIAKALHGSWMAPPQGFDDPDVALMIGINPLVSYQGTPFGHPGRWLADQRRRGMQLVVVDPRESDIARRATLHLKARPGTDAAVVAAMLHVIIGDGLLDTEFVADHVKGLDVLRAHVDRFEPATVATLADIDRHDLVHAARLFARADRGYAIAGTGPAMSGPGTLIEYLVLDLVTVCGRWLREGEVVRNPGSLLPPQDARAQAAPPRPGYGFGERLRVRGLTDTAAGLPTAALTDEILLPGEGQVRALLSCSGNPASAWPDHTRTVQALESLDLLVQVDPWMSQTSMLADYVIAPTMPLETPDVTILHDLPMTPHLGPLDPWAQYTPAVADPPPGAQLIAEWEFFFGLARRMGVTLRVDTQLLFPIEPFDVDVRSKPTTDELIERLAGNGRVSLAAVKRHPGGVSIGDPAVRVAPAEPGWPGRLQLASPEMMRDLDAVDLSPTGDAGAFRLVCRRTTQAYNSSCIDESTHRGRLYNPAFMHPLDMADLRLAVDDVVEITARGGSVRAVVQPDPRLRRGMVSMSHGYGGVALDADAGAGPGANVNVLLTVDEMYDRYSGQPLMSNVPVKLTPLAARSDRPI